MQRDEIYMSGFMHDIGKFLERSKVEKVNDEFEKVDHGHPKYSAQLLAALQKGKIFSQYSDNLVDSVLYHHQPRNKYEKMIQLADWLSSSERRKDEEETGRYYRTPLEAIFANIFKGENDKSEKLEAYELNKLALNQIFPRKDAAVNEHNYRRLTEDFKREIGQIDTEEKFYYLMEKYLWSVPAQTYKNRPDVSLFDHAKTTAAIALCLFDQEAEGNFNPESIRSVEDLKSYKEDQLLLISGDLSGIQDFIFEIASKGAAKSLKGRSVYLDLISKVVTRYILKELNLKKANLLYNGGGNFYILAPAVKENEVESLKRKISHKMLKAHQGSLYYALEYIKFSTGAFIEFSELWREVSDKIGASKKKKWNEIMTGENYFNIFGPLDGGMPQEKECGVCGREITGYINEIGEDNSCRVCRSFTELTDDLRQAEYLNFEIVSPKRAEDWDELKDYNDIFSLFGFKIKLTADKIKADRTYLLNDANFLAEGCDGFIFGSYNLPMGKEGQITFEELSNPAKLDNKGKLIADKADRGDKKLGVLKMDVDNLGAIFDKGLGKNRTISRITTLSRMFGMFFEGHINQLIEEKNWQDNIYVVFSGGDDSFAVGTWNVLFEFAQEFNRRFRDYTCRNENITLSAGLNVFRYNFPVIKSAEITELHLDMAKNARGRTSANLPKKDSIAFLGEIFSWKEFEKIKSIRDILIEIVRRTGNRAVLYKVQKSTLGFRKLLEDSKAGLYDNVRFWRLAYYLREAREDARDLVEKLIEEYKDIIINNLIAKTEHDKVKKIMIIPVAVRWAEMETRKIEEVNK